jgi:hypothetical protein
MRFPFVLLAIGLTISSFSQMIEIKEKNSFYLGYRGAVNVAFNIQPTVHTTFATDQQKSSLAGVVLAPSIGYTFALSNKVSVQLQGEMHKTTRDSRDDYDFYPEIQVMNRGSYTYLDEEVGTPNYSGRSLALKFNFHLKNKASLAPIGSHISLGVKQTWLRADHSNMVVRESWSNWQDPLSISLKDYVTNHKMIALTFDYVTRDMLTDKLFIDLGFGMATPAIQTSYSSDPKTRLLDDAMVAGTTSRYLLHDVLRISFGLGYVLH